MITEGTSSLVSAVDWAERLAFGTLATSIAIIAVAAVGFLMLTGRVDARRGLTVAAGCFLIFGARTIVTGLRSSTNSEAPFANVEQAPPTPIYVQRRVAPPPIDPYSGAAVPHENTGNPWAS